MKRTKKKTIIASAEAAKSFNQARKLKMTKNNKEYLKNHAKNLGKEKD